VLLILLTCFIIFPGCVMLNRGNHEDAVMNHRYGFTREVHQKYRHNADRLLKLIDQVYRHLPLGTLINNKIFVVHGGISDSTDLNLIASVRRSKVSGAEACIERELTFLFLLSTCPFSALQHNRPTTLTQRPSGSKSSTSSGVIPSCRTRATAQRRTKEAPASALARKPPTNSSRNTT
jgi:Calcineurin-like phosphoesterase